MIYTFTLNPSMDYIMDIENPKLGEINRSRSEVLKVGGKGINVSLVLKVLGCESVICTLTAGTVGESIKSEIEALGIDKRIVETEGCSRINVKIAGERETAFNGSGCRANHEHINKLCNMTKSSSEDYIILSGSVCRGLDTNVYAYIMERLKGRFVVDTTGELLLNTLKHKPFLIKPNNEELGEIFGCPVDTFEKAKIYGRKLCEMGAENVIVSMGEKGSVFVNMEETYTAEAEKIKAVNTVGAGDAMVGGFLFGFINTGNFKDALAEGMRASAFWLRGGILL